MRNKENSTINDPCPKSPNITPNSKGKLMIVKRAGFISWYLGTP